MFHSLRVPQVYKMAKESRAGSSWLMFMVGLNMFTCVIGMFLAVVGIVAVSCKKVKPEKEHSLNMALAFFVLLLGAFTIIILVNFLPIVAELKKKPKLHMIYRNWTILILISQVLWLIVVLDGIGPQLTGLGRAVGAENSPGSIIISIFVTIFTLFLVQCRMEELRAEIGHLSFLRFT